MGIIIISISSLELNEVKNVKCSKCHLAQNKHTVHVCEKIKLIKKQSMMGVEEL